LSLAHPPPAQVSLGFHSKGSEGEGRRVKRRGPGPEASWDGGPTRPPCPFASGPYDSHHRRGCPDLLWAARWQVHRTVRDGWPWHGRTARMGLAIGSRPYAVERDPERDPPPVVESSCRAYPHSPNTSRVLFTAAHVQARAVRGGAGGGGAAHHVRRRHGPPIDN